MDALSTLMSVPGSARVRRPDPRRRLAGWVVAATLALAAAACSSSVSPEVPTEPPTSIPSALPTDLSGATSACLDSATMDLLSQMQAPDADVEGIVAANKETLISGLAAFQPPDEVTATWRDDLVAALQAGDMAAAADQVSALTTAGITLTTC